jgi:hypothetical protein
MDFTELGSKTTKKYVEATFFRAEKGEPEPGSPKFFQRKRFPI